MQNGKLPVALGAELPASHVHIIHLEQGRHEKKKELHLTMGLMPFFCPLARHSYSSVICKDTVVVVEVEVCSSSSCRWRGGGLSPLCACRRLVSKEREPATCCARVCVCLSIKNHCK